MILTAPKDFTIPLSVIKPLHVCTVTCLMTRCTPFSTALILKLQTSDERRMITCYR